MKNFARFILRLTGWSIEGELPAGMRQCILIEAPHTSAWDFVWGRLCFFALGVPVRFLIKKEAFFFPFGGMLKALGGIPVDREKKSNKVLEVAALFRHHPDLILAIAPEGTRKLEKHWKKGFYYIAQHAHVPILLSSLDYEKKIGGLGPLIVPSGDYRADMAIINDFYRGKVAKYPENFSLHEFSEQAKKRG